jgi:uncharacterized protein (TIGR02001 family)
MTRGIGRFHLLLLVCGAVLFAPHVARAADAPASQSPWAFYVDVVGATDYVYRGISQTDNDPTFQVSLEADYDIFYAGTFISNVDYGSTDAEIDAIAGVRPSLGDVTFDFAYYHYFYADDSTPSYGEIYGDAEYAKDPLKIGIKAYFAPDYSQSDTQALYVEAYDEYKLPSGFKLSGAAGYQFFDADYGESYLTWRAGLSWTWNDTVEIGALYTDTDLSRRDCANLATRANNCDARIVGSITISGSWPPGK